MNCPTSQTPLSPQPWFPRPLLLPTMYDLPSENPEESGLPDLFHGLQPQLLDETLSLPQYSEEETFQAFDLNVYYDEEHTGWYKRPDWFFVIGASRLYQGVVTRSSYVMWEEKISPTIVIEFLSPGTEAEDLGRFANNLAETSKKKSAAKSRSGKQIKPGKPGKPGKLKPPSKFVVYEEILKVPNYIVFDNKTKQIRFFRLVNDVYEEQTMSPTSPRLWIPELNLGLGLRPRKFRGITQPWLSWCDQAGNFFPTPAEAAEAQTIVAQAETIAAQAETIEAQAKTIAAQAEITAAEEKAAAAIAQLEQIRNQQTQSIVKLLDAGMGLEQVAEIVGVTIATVEAVQANASANP
jgi:Uma2 family endonuclease